MDVRSSPAQGKEIAADKTALVLQSSSASGPLGHGGTITANSSLSEPLPLSSSAGDVSAVFSVMLFAAGEIS